MKGVIPNWTTGIFRPNNRSIGGIVAQVTITEQERDELTITEHPVEQGAPISDHAFKRPSEVTIRAGWSAAVAGDLSANGNGVYGLLLSWQVALNPFKLYTGKRSYDDMLIQSLTVATDNHSEFALMAEIVCRQVVIVKVSTSQASTSSDPANHADPESTSPPASGGDQQPREAGNGTQLQSSDSSERQHQDQTTGDQLSERQHQDTVATPNVSTSPEGMQVENAASNNVTPEQAGQKGMDNGIGPSVDLTGAPN